MTSLIISSSNKDWQIRAKEILTQFLEGQTRLSKLQEQLAAYVTIDFQAQYGRREIRNIAEGRISLDDFIKIPVRKRHVCNMLERYLGGELSEAELSDWAAFIRMFPVFVPEGETEEEQWQAGESLVWDVLDRLAAPVAFGGLNPQTARHYLGLLHSID